MKQYKKYVIPYKSAFILGPIFMIVEVLGEIILPKLMSMIINYGCGQDVTVAAKGPAYIIGIGAAMIGTALLMMMGGVLGAYFAVKASVNFAGDLRRDVFAKVQKFSFANIEKFSTGSLVTRLTNDITNIQNVLSMGLRMLLRAPGMLIGGLIMAFLMNAKLALVFCVNADYDISNEPYGYGSCLVWRSADFDWQYAGWKPYSIYYLCNADSDVAYDGFHDYDSGFSCDGIFSSYFGSVRYGH